MAIRSASEAHRNNTRLADACMRTHCTRVLTSTLIAELEAKHNLGVCYANGFGVTKDNVLACSWYKKVRTPGVILAAEAVFVA
jgi:TPR repeat protein